MESHIALINATVIDGNSPGPLANHTLIIKGRIIEKVGKKEEVVVPRDAEEWDMAGMFILPGFIDGHVHLASYSGDQKIVPRLWNLENPAAVKVLHAYKNAKETLMAGFTTVRNAGKVTTHEPEDIILRDAIREGVVLGPRILACGGGVSMTGGHGALHFPPYLQVAPELGFGERTADGPDEVRKEVRRRLRMGADFIKIYTSGGVATYGDQPEYNNWTLEEIRAATEEAHNFGRKVGSHAQGLQAVKNAVMGGVDSIEHGCVLDDEAIEMMLKRGTYLVSTLIVLRTIALDKGKLPASNLFIEKAKSVTDVHFCSLSKAHRAGVKIVFATDTQNFLRHGDNAKEFRCLVEAGLSPMEAIKAATRNAAEAFDLLDELGTIEEGKLADLLVIRGNPLDDIIILEDKSRIKIVIKEGSVVKNDRPGS